MNDLNMINAHNTELRSIGSPSGLACDAPSSPAERTLVDEFRRIMDEAGHNETEFPMKGMAGSEKPHDFLTAPEDREPAMPLESLFSMRPGVSSSAITEAGSVPLPLPPDTLETLVDRILVSSAELGRAEVRLTLSDSVLDGTEIHLRRDHDGKLIVSLHCTSETSFQTLVASQMDLRERLEDFENRSVQLSVDIDREDGQADRRSRGYIALDEQEPEPSNA